MKKSILLSIVLLFVVVAVKAQCVAGFTWTQTSANTISFTNTSSGAGSPSYYWHFGDGNTDHVTNPTNFYATPGTYWACVTLYNGGHACNTFCDSVVVTGSHHCNLMITPTVVNASCASCVDGSISVSVSGGTAPYHYTWSTGDSTHSVSGHPGTYWVCVTDSSGCSSCDTIHIGNHSSTTCHASFSLHSDSSLAHHYWAYNLSTGTHPISYYWTWGDGSYDTISHPGHGYASPGTYTICLYIFDGTGCSDSICSSHHFARTTASATMASVDVVDGITTGINPTNLGAEFALYPNPTSDLLMIKTNIKEKYSVSIFNILGEKIYSADQTTYFQLSVAEWKSGLYFVQIISNKNSITQKFIKQ